MKKFLPITILVLVFFIFKLTTLGIRLSDSNIYFYTGYKLLQGQVLYKDIFFTNFPLFPYISSIYFLLLGGSLKLFFLTPAIEVSVIAFLIYKIIYKKHKDIFLSFTSSAIYLFSFIILSTSDHQTGVFAASLFAVLSFYFYSNKKYLLSGVFIALAVLTKAYFIPILISYLVLFFWERKFKNIQKFLLGGFFVTSIIMLPTIIFVFPEFLKNTFEYSLTRSQGVSKTNIVWFFITHDLLFFILLIFNLISIKTSKFFGLLSIFGIAFFIFYRDTYYLYLNFLIPFLALSYPEFSKTITEKLGVQKFVVPTFVFGFLFFSFISYSTGFRNLQKINLDRAIEIVRKENPKSLYGADDIAPALSYLSGVPLLNGVIDTNANIYRKGILDSKKMTADAISQKSIIVAHGAEYPDMGFREIAVGEIFDKEQISAKGGSTSGGKKSCKLIGSFPVQTEGLENRLNLLRCY